MKNLFITGIIFLLIASCGSKELSRGEAYQILNQEMQYPKTYDYDVFSSDPAHAKKMLDAGLENEGLVTINQTQKIVDIGKPLIEFTDKAEPYLLPTAEEDQSIDIQKVKIADEELAEVTEIKYDSEGKSAVVEYTTAFKDITPFAVLVRTDLNKPTVHSAHFFLYDDGWKLEGQK